MTVNNLFFFLFLIFKNLIHNSHFNVILPFLAFTHSFFSSNISGTTIHDILYYCDLDINFCSLKLYNILKDFSSKARRIFWVFALSFDKCFLTNQVIPWFPTTCKWRNSVVITIIKVWIKISLKNIVLFSYDTLCAMSF